MKIWKFVLWNLSGLLACSHSLAAPVKQERALAAPAALDPLAYSRAAKLQPARLASLLQNAEIKPYWNKDSSSFWYRKADGKGHRFIRVDAETGRARDAFNHDGIATSLSRLVARPIAPNQLPFETLAWQDDEQEFTVRVDGKPIRCVLVGSSCEAARNGISLAAVDHDQKTAETLSPDGRSSVLYRDGDLWLRSADRADVRLTKDASSDIVYAAQRQYLGDVTGGVLGWQEPPDILWRADSRAFVALRIDRSKIRRATLIRNVDGRGRAPGFASFDYPLVDDKNYYRTTLVAFDLETEKNTTLFGPYRVADYASPIESGYIWWSGNDRLHLLAEDRFRRDLVLHALDLTSGRSRALIREAGETPVLPHPGDYSDRSMVRIMQGSDEVVWFSQRDGWGHLYLHRLSDGALKRQLTSGSFLVREVVHVDSDRRVIYFLASGREPDRDLYSRQVYSVSLDGGAAKLLTPEAADHAVMMREETQRQRSWLGMTPDGNRAAPSPSGFSPNGRHFVETMSTANTGPLTLLRRSDGSIVTQIDETDLAPLRATGWKPHIPFTVKAADGQTDLHGAMFTPSTFNPQQRYPTIQVLYGAPTSQFVPKTVAQGIGNVTNPFHLLAEAGFIVITLDGRGTPYRSRAFGDFQYQAADRPELLADQVAALRALAARHPFIDLERVGVYGQSFGGYSATRALFVHADLFKTGVAVAGMQSMDLDGAPFGDWLNGPLSDSGYERQHNRNLPKAGAPGGPLLLIHGDMDAITPAWGALQLTERMMEANQDFELLLVPNAGHSGIVLKPYVLRRILDHFTRHLYGAVPKRADFGAPRP